MTAVMPIMPDQAETELAQSALRDLAEAISDQASAHLHFAHGVDVVVSPSALAALTQILSTFAQGEGVTVLPAQEELTTQQAAEVMNVSRPYLIGLLEAGKIRYRVVGNRRRVSAASLAEYMRADDIQRKAAVEALSAETYELGFVWAG